MDFVISNFPFEGSKSYGALFYSGACVNVEGSLIVRKSSDFKFFGKFAGSLRNADPATPFSGDDFYFIADYCADSDNLLLQTDLIGYEAAFLWKKGDLFVLSDDVFAIDNVIRTGQGERLGLNEEKVREFLYYSALLFDDTVFENVIRLEPASISLINVHNGAIEQKSYDGFKMRGEISCAETAADRLCDFLDEYFESHYCPDTRYSIGMSGGLDSRVGAFFAKKHNYDVHPIFIGVKKNKVGIVTNDVKRARAVNSYLGFGDIEYYDPRIVSLEEKVAFDSINAPNMSSNIQQNMGNIENLGVLIHAMMGGEAFGQLVPGDIDNYSEEDLAQFMLDKVSKKPRYKTSNGLLIRAARYRLLPKSIANKLVYCDAAISDELVSEESRIKAFDRVLTWVKQQRSLGLDNINIWHKMFYYRFAVIAKTGYYSTLNNTVPSLPTYINAGFVREMLSWDSDLLLDRKVQKALIKRLDGLADLRSQTFDATINATRFRRIKKFFYVLERLVRGGAMVYTDWFSKREIQTYIERNAKDGGVASRILDSLSSRAWYNDPSALFSLMKIEFIENYLHR